MLGQLDFWRSSQLVKNRFKPFAVRNRNFAISIIRIFFFHLAGKFDCLQKRNVATVFFHFRKQFLKLFVIYLNPLALDKSQPFRLLKQIIYIIFRKDKAVHFQKSLHPDDRIQPQKRFSFFAKLNVDPGVMLFLFPPVRNAADNPRFFNLRNGF